MLPARHHPGTTRFSISLGFHKLLHYFHWLWTSAVLLGRLQHSRLPWLLTFITREHKALILPQWWDSSWDSVQFPPAHETLSAPFSAPHKHTSIKPIFPHKGLQLPWRLVLGTDILSYPFLPISLYTGIKTIAAASPSLPKMDFIRVLLLATGLASPSEL